MTERELLTKNYNLAKELKRQGKSNAEIKQAVMAEGLDEEKANGLLKTLSNISANSLSKNPEDRIIEDDGSSSDSGSSSWIFYILGLLAVNLLSWLFDWPFWIY